MFKLQILAVTFFFLFPIALFADQIVLKNGDRLTGSIEKSDEKTLVIKTEFAGEVTVQWPAVQEINSTQTLHVSLNNGQTVVGTVTTSDGNLTVATANAGPVTEPKASVTKLLGEADQTAYEKSLHPGLLEGWQGGANVGFGLTRGNSQTKNLAVAFTADRKGWRDKLSLYTNSIYATNDAPGATPGTTANAIQGGARYDHDLSPRIFGYVGADFQTDALQTLDLRSVFGGGLGWHAIKNDRTTVTKISKWLGWQNAFGDIYVTNPPAGAKQNDILLTMGLNFSFAH